MEQGAIDITGEVYRRLFSKGWPKRLLGQWATIFVLSEAVAAILSLFGDLDSLRESAQRGVNFLTMGLFYSGVAVAWHRYFLLDEDFSGLLSALPRLKSLLYMAMWTAAAFISGAVLIVPFFFILWAVFGPEPAPDTTVLAIIVMMPGYVYLQTRLLFLLPAVATGRMGVLAAWRLARGKVWRIFAATFVAILLPYMAVGVVQLIERQSSDLTLVPLLLLDFLITGLMTLMLAAGAGTLSLLMRNFIVAPIGTDRARLPEGAMPPDPQAG